MAYKPRKAIESHGFDPVVQALTLFALSRKRKKERTTSDQWCGREDLNPYGQNIQMR
jgi:hypothetical protein